MSDTTKILTSPVLKNGDRLVVERFSRPTGGFYCHYEKRRDMTVFLNDETAEAMFKALAFFRDGEGGE
jgi:hypothetical protein